jgi:hypothetical protein
VIEIATFVCSICGESSTDICVYCTKDTCSNHRCVRCRRCSDCCECELPLTAAEPVRETVATATEPWLPQATQPEPARHLEPLPELEPLPRTEPVPATTAEELIQSLPELFAPDVPPPAPPELPELPDEPHVDHAEPEAPHGHHTESEEQH